MAETGSNQAHFEDDAESTPQPESKRQLYAEGDSIVISKALLINLGIALAFFIGGGLLGTFFGPRAFGLEQQIAASPPAAPQTAPQPPARVENISVEGAHLLGSQQAQIAIVEFSDFRCGFCRRFHNETFAQLEEEYGDRVQFAYRHYPVVGGQLAAEASECAAEQNAFWEFHDVMFSTQGVGNDADAFVSVAEEMGLDTDAFRTCFEEGRYRDKVAADMNQGRELGITGTPTFFINGVRFVGAQPIENFRQVIDQELEAGG